MQAVHQAEATPETMPVTSSEIMMAARRIKRSFYRGFDSNIAIGDTNIVAMTMQLARHGALPTALRQNRQWASAGVRDLRPGVRRMQYLSGFLYLCYLNLVSNRLLWCQVMPVGHLCGPCNFSESCGKLRAMVYCRQVIQRSGSCYDAYAFLLV